MNENQIGQDVYLSMAARSTTAMRQNSIQEYLSRIPIEKSQVLKEELYYNVAFTKRFEVEILDLSLLLSSLIRQNKELETATFNNMLSRYDGNCYVEDMHSFYQENLGAEDLHNYYFYHNLPVDWDNVISYYRQLLTTLKEQYFLKQNISSGKDSSKLSKI